MSILPFFNPVAEPGVSERMIYPDLRNAAFVAEGATLIGRITLSPGSSIWYGAVIRGDLEAITIGQCSNIQDGAILHCDPGEPIQIQDYVTIGHNAVIHSAQVESGCLIGIGVTVLNGVRVGSGSIIGAGSVLTKSVPERSLVMGIPGKVVREVRDEEAAGLIEHAKEYEKLAIAHAKLQHLPPH